MEEYKYLAESMSASIRALAADDERLANFESYLAHCFGSWMEKYANNPYGLTAEFEHFATM